MTRTLVFANRKGGCGKTSTSVNVAHALASLGRQVLLLDMDPQSHATLSMGFSTDTAQKSIFSALNGSVPLTDIISPTRIQGLFLVPASRDLVSVDLNVKGFEGDETLLAQKLSPLRNAYDFIIIDPPPAVNKLSVSALVAAQEVFIPMPMHFLALEGLAEMTRLVYTINATSNPLLRIKGIIPTFFNKSTRIAKEITRDIQKNFGEGCLYPGIRMNVSVAEAPGYGQSVLEYAPQSIGAKDYKTLAWSIDAGLGTPHPEFGSAEQVQ